LDKLDKLLLSLEEQKESISNSLLAVGVRPAKKRKSKNPAKKKELSNRKKVKTIQETATKELLVSLVEQDEYFYCSVLEQRQAITACLCKTFIKNYPRHKKCIKCLKFSEYIDKIIARIKECEAEIIQPVV
jgi:hypothetical protein